MNNNDFTKSLLNNGISAQCISQYLKALEDGFDIYNRDIKLSADKLRDFRLFLKDNFKPIFDHGQLREMQLGYIKNLDIMQYADEKYNQEAMCVLRKTLENGQSLDIVKKYGKNAKHMKEISRGLQYNLDEIDFEKYNLKQLILINEQMKKGIDARTYIDDGYSNEQIDTILLYKKDGINIENYITCEYEIDCIQQLALLLSKNSYKDIEQLFNPKFSSLQLLTLRHLVETNKDWKEAADPNYDSFKMNCIITSIDNNEPQEKIDALKKSNFATIRYIHINNLLQHYGLSDIFLDKTITNQKIALLDKNTDLNVFKKLSDMNYNIENTQLILHLYKKNKDVDLLEYTNNDMSSADIRLIYNCLVFTKNNNIEYDNDYIINIVKKETDLNIIQQCIDNNIDYKRINWDLSYEQKKQLIQAQIHNIDIFDDIRPEFKLTQITSIISAKSKGLSIDNLLIPNLNTEMYKIILCLENFNKKNERQIDIQEILNLNCDISKIKELTFKLMSNDLDNHINAYKEISELNKKIENNNPDLIL